MKPFQLSYFLLLIIGLAGGFSLAIYDSVNHIDTSSKLLTKERPLSPLDTAATTTASNEQLTALLYHVETSRACGINLQKFNIDFEQLWLRKFSSQVRKSIHLTNMLNHLIHSNAAESAANGGSKTWPEFSKHILNSNLIESLSYFMLGSQSPNNAHSASLLPIITATKTAKTTPTKILTNSSNDTATTFSSSFFTKPSGGLSFFDFSFNQRKEQVKSDELTANNQKQQQPVSDLFLVGYGVVLNDSPDGSSETANGRVKCLFISPNPSYEANKNQEYFVRSTACSAMNIRPPAADSTNPYPPYAVTSSAFSAANVEDDQVDEDSEEKDTETASDADIDDGENIINSGNNGRTHVNEDLTRNCHNWYASFRSAYAASQAGESRKQTNAWSSRLYLERLLNSTSFGKSIWCGPFSECSSAANSSAAKSLWSNQQPPAAAKVDWILNFHLPLFEREKRLRGAVLVKLKLNRMDVNQCPDGDPVFAGTHKCKPGAECLFVGARAFRAGNYMCRCARGHINSNGAFTAYNGSVLEKQYWLLKNNKPSNYTNGYNCLPCPSSECCRLETLILDESNLVASVSSQQQQQNLYSEEPSGTAGHRGDYNIFFSCRKYNMTLRYTLLIIQFIFILLTISIACVIFYFRHNKVYFCNHYTVNVNAL